MEGKCACGCGGTTSVVRESRLKLGLRKGDYRRYISGHQGRKSGTMILVMDAGYNTPCWLWQLANNSRGYSVIWHNGKMNYGHIRFYTGVNGDLRGGLQLDHLCRNRTCVRPDHLEPVTPRENTQRIPSVKIRDADVPRIVECLEKGMIQKEIAALYGTSQGVISRALSTRGIRRPQAETVEILRGE